MADGIDVKVDIPPFKRQMQELGTDFERKTVRAATSAATGIFRDAVIQAAPVSRDFLRKGASPGRLKRAIYRKRSKDSTSGREHFFVGVRYGKKERRRKAGSRDAFYWRWVEEGHLARGPGQKIRGGRRRRALERNRLKGSGAHRVEARPFLGAGFKQAGRAGLDKFTTLIARRIDKANRK